MKVIREYTPQQISERKKRYEKTGVTAMIFNPPIQVGKFKIHDIVQYKGKNYYIHSFADDNPKQATLQMLTVKNHIDKRAKNTIISIDCIY